MLMALGQMLLYDETGRGGFAGKWIASTRRQLGG